LELPDEYNFIVAFNLFDLSLFSIGDKLRLNPFKKMRDDENQQATP
jgi:hypothetical protein